jgi:hypothetical protein
MSGVWSVEGTRWISYTPRNVASVKMTMLVSRDSSTRYLL